MITQSISGPTLSKELLPCLCAAHPTPSWSWTLPAVPCSAPAPAPPLAVVAVGGGRSRHGVSAFTSTPTTGPAAPLLSYPRSPVSESTAVNTAALAWWCTYAALSAASASSAFACATPC